MSDASQSDRQNTIETDTNADVEGEAVRRERVGQLLDRRRRNLSRDRHIGDEKYGHRDNDGDKIHRVTYERDSGETITVDSNLTKLLSAAPSTTSNAEIIKVEAQQAASANERERERMNPHIPANEDLLDDVTEDLERDGLTPAWEVVDSTAEVSGA